MGGSLFFRILGPIKVERGGRALELSGFRLQAVASLLLLRAGRGVSSETLVDAIWGGEPPPTARKAVQVAVWKLRRLFEGDPALEIETRDQGYLLRVDPERVDALRFESLVERAGGALAQGEPQVALDLLDTALSL